MAEEKQDATQESSPALSEAMAESAAAEEEAQEAQPSTAEQEETQEQKEVPFHEHPRFKELVEEKNKWRDMAMQHLQSQQQNLPQQVQTPQDPYAGLTAEERVFWQRVEEIADKKAEAKIQRMNPMISAGLQEIATMKVAQFRKDHPDIHSNSPEEAEIANRIKSGYSPDDAYWAVMGPRGVKKAEDVAEKRAKQKFIQKKAANVENSPGVSSPSKSKAKETIEETFERLAKEQGVTF